MTCPKTFKCVGDTQVPEAARNSPEKIGYCVLESEAEDIVRTASSVGPPAVHPDRNADDPTVGRSCGTEHTLKMERSVDTHARTRHICARTRQNGPVHVHALL